MKIMCSGAKRGKCVCACNSNEVFPVGHDIKIGHLHKAIDSGEVAGLMTKRNSP